MKFIFCTLLLLFCHKSFSNESTIDPPSLSAMEWLIGSWTNEDKNFRQTYQWSMKRTQIHTIVERKQSNKWETVIKANFIYHPLKEVILAYGTSSELELVFYELMMIGTEDGIELYSESVNSNKQKVSSVSFWHNISSEKFEILPIEAPKEPTLPWLYGAWYKVK